MRKNYYRTINISARVANDSLPSLILNEIKQQIAKIDINPNIKINYAGEDEDQAGSQEFLSKAFFYAIAGMFFIILLQFNSFYQTLIVLSAIFLSTIGVLLGLLLTSQPFGIVMCGIGIITLAGTVVTSNIIFLDTYNDLLKEGLTIKEAIIETGKQRLRPILLTTITSVIGLYPMIIGLDINILEFDYSLDSPSSAWWKQLSITIVSGMSFATILTLLLTPCLLILKKETNNY